jgi:hypothetical protein
VVGAGVVAGDAGATVRLGADGAGATGSGVGALGLLVADAGAGVVTAWRFVGVRAFGWGARAAWPPG